MRIAVRQPSAVTLRLAQNVTISTSPTTRVAIATARSAKALRRTLRELEGEGLVERSDGDVRILRADGLVVLRYTDEAASVLSPHRNASRVGRDLAIDLADEVVKMWPDDPRLWRPNRPFPKVCPDEDASAPSLVESKRRREETETAALPEIPFHGIRKASDPR